MGAIIIVKHAGERQPVLAVPRAVYKPLSAGSLYSAELEECEVSSLFPIIP